VKDLEEIRAALNPICEDLITELCVRPLGITEGKVMSPGVPPYRRLDCDARALCYVRVRPKKRAVRVDVSGLWVLPGECPLQVPGSSGNASYMVRSTTDVDELVAFLAATVRHTRYLYRTEAQRRLPA
jgi:hypothetical protein